MDYNEKAGNLNILNEPLIDGSLLRFRLPDANLVPTQVATSMGIELYESGESFTGPYSEFMAVLLYLAITVRSDISFLVGKLVQY